MKLFFKLCTFVLIMIAFITCCYAQEPIDYAKIKHEAEKACNLNNGLGCLALGELYHKGLGVKQDYQQAKTYYEKACNLNYGMGCHNLGVLCTEGQGVRQDYDQAKIYYEKACSLNFGDGCYNLGFLYDNGQGVEQNYQQAKTYYEKACNLNNGSGCHNLGFLYDNEQGVKQNYAQAEIYYEKACNMGNAGSCYNLGILYGKGQGVVQDDVKAREYISKACDLGLQKSCDALKLLQEQGKKIPEQSNQRGDMNKLSDSESYFGLLLIAHIIFVVLLRTLIFFIINKKSKINHPNRVSWEYWLAIFFLVSFSREAIENRIISANSEPSDIFFVVLTLYIPILGVLFFWDFIKCKIIKLPETENSINWKKGIIRLWSIVCIPIFLFIQIAVFMDNNHYDRLDDDRILVGYLILLAPPITVLLFKFLIQGFKPKQKLE